MKKTASFSFLFLPLLLLATSCVVQGQHVSPMDHSQYGRPPIRASALLLIPEDFQHFVYVSAYEGNEIRYPLGREGARELRSALGIEFASVEVRTVRSEAEAMAMLDPGDPVNVEVRAYDYVVIPKFMRVDSSVDNYKYSFEIDLLTELYAKDGAIVTKIKGHGESRTGKWSGSTPEDGAQIALQSAISAILDGIGESRSLFVH